MSQPISCINMIKQQLRTGDVLDQRILSLYKDLPREAFVPEALQHFAYTDMQLTLPHGERMMTPLEEAALLQALALKGHETLLEVGTGTGFLTALLSRLCRHVISIDYYADFTADANQRLIAHGCHNVELLTGSAALGWIDRAPYDVVILSGAIHSVTETHRLQVLPGGKLFAIIGQSPVMQGQLHHLDHHGLWHEELVFETDLPALINTHKQNNFIF